MVNSPLIRPYFLGGVALGGFPLSSHELMCTSLLWLPVGTPEQWGTEVHGCFLFEKIRTIS